MAFSPKAVFKTSSGIVQVDGRYKNLYFHRKFNLSSGAQTITFLTQSPACYAIQSVEGVSILPKGNLGDNLQTKNEYYVYGNCTTYEFSAQTIQRAAVGLNIYNEITGELVFSSNIKPMRVVAAISGTAQMVQGEVLYSRQLPADRSYAVVMGNLPIRIQAVAGNQINYFTAKITTTTNGFVSIVIESAANERAFALNGDLIFGTYQFLVIDVTDY